MKHICLVVIILIAACSSHRTRCDGALRPINSPFAAAKLTAPGGAAAPRADTAAPGPVTTSPGRPATAKPQPLPAEPRP
jgi:hypothetical protein